MERQKFISALVGTAALSSTGAGLLLSSCGEVPLEDNIGGSFAGYPHGPVRAENFTNPLFIPGSGGPFGVLSVTDTPLALAAQAKTFPIFDNRLSPFLLYDTSYAAKSYQNPILRIKSGSRFTATLQNDLNEPTIVHWHGLHLSATMDGHSNDSIAPGKNYPYAFPVTNRGGTYWYHTHADQLTAKQAYGGLASFFTVEDDDEMRVSSGASKAVQAMLNLAPSNATVIHDDQPVEVPTSEVVMDDIVMIRPGDKIPVDGTLTDDESNVDESMITGESMPIGKKIGDGVIGATINKTGTFRFKATKVGADVAMEAADVVLMKSDPFDVIGAIILSRATRRKMRQNIWWAAGYNVIAFPLAAGLLYPNRSFIKPGDRCLVDVGIDPRRRQRIAVKARKDERKHPWRERGR